MMKYNSPFHYSLFLLLFITQTTFAQQQTCSFKGKVIDIETNQPLKDVLIEIQYTNITTQSNSQGDFVINGLAPGVYTLKFILFDYETLIIPRQELKAGVTKILYLEMFKSKKAGEVFFIGGIEVVADKEIIHDKIYTATVIQSSDIEHIQATSLGDVLDLVPGTEIRSQPALKEAKHALIREPQDINELTSFGTKIIINDIPISNNANLQEARSVFSGVAINAGTGIDLREIPADNIESVEVIRGIAPAKYGDYLAGIINVKTKFDSKSHYRLKTKYNPDTKEINFGGGVNLKNTGINYNINWAHSLKDIRKDYDNVQRLSVQTIFKNKFLDDKILTTNVFHFYKLFEDIDLNPSDESSLATYNHGCRFNYGFNNDIRFTETFSVHQKFYVNFNKIDSYKQKYNPADNRVISTLLIPGTMAGIKQFSGYLYQYYTRGKEISLGFELEWIKKFLYWGTFHELSGGVLYQLDENKGRGIQFDMLKPPAIGDRPYSFDSVPGTVINSIFLNDQITLKNCTLNLGLRFEKYAQANNSLISHKNGAFLNPRINLAYYIHKNTQIRMGYGTSSKSPAINFIFPQSEYLDVKDIVPVIRDNSTLYVHDSLVTTYVFNGANPHLKGYQERKWELSFEQRLGDLGISITAFYNVRKDEPINNRVPYIYHRYCRPNWPDSAGEQISETYLGYYQTWINGGWSKYDGIEMSIVSKKIDRLNSSFSLQATYYHSKHGENGLFLDINAAKDLTIPYYKKNNQWFQKLILTYQINYTSKPLGIWLSLTAQHVPHFISKTTGYGDSLAVALYDGSTGKIDNIPPNEAKKYHRRLDYSYYKVWRYPNKWIFNIRLSKSLFPGAEVSLYVNNFMDDRAFYKSFTNSYIYYSRNPEIFYGIEFSVLLDNFKKKL